MIRLCNPDTVEGAVLAGFEAMGVRIDPKILEGLNTTGKSVYFEHQAQASKNLADATAYLPQGSVDHEVLQGWATFKDNPVSMAARFVTDLRNPSGILGEQYVQPLNAFLVEHYQKYANDPLIGRRQYFKKIRDVFDGMDVSGLKPSQQGYFERWRYFYIRGGEFYNHQPGNAALEVGNNLISHYINLNDKILLGHMVEGVIKLPTLYPKTMFQGMLEAAKRGPWRELPELQSQGVYGQFHGSGTWLDKAVRRVTGLADVPLKNISYFSGYAAGGQAEALRAVQRVSFQTRFGDLPIVYHNPAGRLLMQMSGYMLNTYKLYGSLWRGATLGGYDGRAKSLYGLLAFHGLVGVIGGTGELLPKPVEEVLKRTNPDLADEIEAHKTAFGELAQIGNFRDLGVTVNMVTEQMKRAKRLGGSALENFAQNGNSARGVCDLVDAGMNLMPFSRNPLGNMNIVKAFDIGRDIYCTDEGESWPEELHKKYANFIK